MNRQFTTVDALLDHDEASPLEWGTFDDELWLLLSDRIVDPAELESFPHAVGVYLASRWLEWEVGNGIKQHLFCKSRFSEVGHLASMVR